MNVLQVLPELNVGGVETGTVDLARYLVKMGHKAVVVSHGGELVKEIESFGAIHYTLPVHKRDVFTIFSMVPKLIQIIKKENIDIVHARSRAPAMSCYWVCRRTGKVFITTCHGYYGKHVFSFTMGWGKRVIVLSNAIARHMIDDLATPYERIRLIPRSVDLEKFRYLSPDEKRKEEFNVGIIGRITPIKGHLDFVKAMAKVNRQYSLLKIWIVGEAPASREGYKEQIQVLVRRLGLAHCTQFLGTQRDIPAILAHLDLLVLATNTQEAFGRVIIEAQASGVPVVATKVGGVVDIIEDGLNGLLVPPSDPQAMSEAVLKIIHDKKLARALAEKAYQKVKTDYNVERMVRSTVELYQEALQNFNLLIIKLSSVGDVILSTAAIRALRQKFPAPKYKITLLVGSPAKEVLLGCPYIDELLVCDLKNKDKGLKGLWKLGSSLRRKNFDLAIDLQNNRSSHILAFLSFALQRYGYNNKKWAFLLNHSIKDDSAKIGPVAHQSRVLSLLGITLTDPHLELWPAKEDADYIDDFLKSEWVSAGQKLAGINISASVRWLTKNWPLENIAKLCDGLSQRDIRPVLTGTEKDSPLVSQVAAMAKNAKIINACGKTTFNQLACLIKKCSVYLGTDSAPLHIAAAMDIPFVALFGPTDPARHLPPAENFVLIKKDLECSPCYRPKCKTGKCMTQISVEEVLEAIEKLLKEG